MPLTVRIHAAARTIRVWWGQSRRRQLAASAGSLLTVLLLTGTGYVYTPLVPDAGATGADAARGAPADRQRVFAQLRRQAPRGRYIVVDQTNNRLYLRQGDQILLDAVCSAGSGLVLREGDGGREWTFDTPRGRFEVLSRIENPIWRKPDWAFVEEGAPIPDNVADRLEPGTLGEYALYFGNGYMIHGTLYERLLGRSVTHGCIRLGRDDLRRLWAAAPIGTPIYIF